MSAGLATALVVFCLVAAIGIGWVWYRATSQSRIFRRIAPALLQWEAFEKLLAHRTDQSHLLERHGPMTYESEQRERALTGALQAAGVDGSPADAGRWRSHHDLLEALEFAHARWASGARPPRGVFRLKFAHVVGDGFAAGCETPVATAHALAVVRKGVVITAFPVIAPDTSLAWEPVPASRTSGQA
jgi:hypothetical protein